MLKRLYADNYRCLVDFELHFEHMNLLLGPNGGGKSTVFDLLFSIRRLLVDQVKVNELFASTDFTAWINMSEPRQSFKIDVEINNEIYTYHLDISYDFKHEKQRIECEMLHIGNKHLFDFIDGMVIVYFDNKPGAIKYSFDRTYSALSYVEAGKENSKLVQFKTWIERLFIGNIQPKTMDSVTHAESLWLKRDCSNFASWYRYFSQEHQDRVIEITKQLREVIPGFHAFKLELAGKARILKVGFVGEDEKDGPCFFDFQDVSDGQRVLIVLYTLLFGLQGLGYTFFLDEPENYVALPEIQPWLMELSDACGEGFPQVVLISHHPELIDYFGGEYGQWIERDPLGPTRVRTSPERIYTGLKLSEQIARGWTE
jgi:predicted ATPase